MSHWVIGSGRFESTWLSYLQQSKCPISAVEEETTSETKYPVKQWHIPEERRLQLHSVVH
jgi:hypothetical protein